MTKFLCVCGYILNGKSDSSLFGDLHVLFKFLESNGVNTGLYLTLISTEVVTMVMHSSDLLSGRKGPCL